MLVRMGIFLTIATFALTTPVAAQGSVAAFDGTYAGVSTDIETAHRDVPRSRCPQLGLPDPLTITNGVVKPPSGTGWTGTVSPQGALVIRNRLFVHVGGQIDPQGNATAEYHGPQCIVKFGWQKQAG
jgi:hypothetical protein